jgi:hypothetical protein
MLDNDGKEQPKKRVKTGGKIKGQKHHKVWNPSIRFNFLYRDKFNCVKKASVLIGNITEFGYIYTPKIGKSKSKKIVGVQKWGVIKTTQRKYYKKISVTTIDRLRTIIRLNLFYRLVLSKPIEITTTTGTTIKRTNKLYEVKLERYKRLNKVIRKTGMKYKKNKPL